MQESIKVRTDMKKLEKLSTSVRLSVYNPKTKSNSMFGKGVASLCSGVSELGSLNAAAKQMGMAYSKAWRIIKDTESALGFQLLDRDGAHGSKLTKEGSRLLDAYLSISDELSKKAAKLYEKSVS